MNLGDPILIPYPIIVPAAANWADSVQAVAGVVVAVTAVLGLGLAFWELVLKRASHEAEQHRNHAELLQRCIQALEPFDSKSGLSKQALSKADELLRSAMPVDEVVSALEAYRWDIRWGRDFEKWIARAYFEKRESP